MDAFKEQHMCIKFCLKLVKTATETLEVKEVAFREETVGRTQVFL